MKNLGVVGVSEVGRNTLRGELSLGSKRRGSVGTPGGGGGRGRGAT
jgi:hypothetical protein